MGLQASLVLTLEENKYRVVSEDGKGDDEACSLIEAPVARPRCLLRGK